jgi:hypothetical protein
VKIFNGTLAFGLTNRFFLLLVNCFIQICCARSFASSTSTRRGLSLDIKVCDLIFLWAASSLTDLFVQMPFLCSTILIHRNHGLEILGMCWGLDAHFFAY